MALPSFGTENNVVIINGRRIQDWGQADPPYTEETIDPKGDLRRGLGGRAVRLDRINPGKRVTISLNPGSPDSAYMHSLMLSKANIVLGRNVIGSLEVATGDEGMITNDGQTGRAGQSITDDVYIMEFNSWIDMKGSSL